ncbi:hypothetical protein [Endozoicomonas ascidiicola]|uniref:hypothetical protein n=1 Tax=Endozoicomonas ascidiicola TaxID=1698521 RepID=UPI000830CA70|nr:hypothetical protein [Endozoicomonas ascidiicola]
METLDYLLECTFLQQSPLNNPDATGAPHSNTRAFSSAAKCFGRTVAQIAITTAKLTYNVAKLALEGIGAGLGAAAGFVEGGARIAGSYIGEHFGWCKRETKSLSEFTIRGLRTGANAGEIAGFLAGVPAAAAATVFTAPINLFTSGVHGVVAGVEVKTKGSSREGDKKMNEHIREFNRCMDDRFQKAHSLLQGQEVSPLDAFLKGLRSEPCAASNN